MKQKNEDIPIKPYYMTENFFNDAIEFLIDNVYLKDHKQIMYSRSYGTAASFRSYAETYPAYFSIGFKNKALKEFNKAWEEETWRKVDQELQDKYPHLTRHELEHESEEDFAELEEEKVSIAHRKMMRETGGVFEL